MMNDLTFSSKIKKVALIAAVVFVVYNIIIFSVCGFSGHGPAFWTSYVFMNIALVSSGVCGFLLKDKHIEPRDWMMGYPFYKHCTNYIIIEFICSVLFMLLDGKNLSGSLTFGVQLVIFAVFIVLITSCFIAKEIIEDVQQDVKVNTYFMKNLLVDVDTVIEKITDKDVKNAFSELRDKVRYSDPVSSHLLSDIEDKIASEIEEANVYVSCNDNSNALESCKKAMLLLSERNRKCKALK